MSKYPLFFTVLILFFILNVFIIRNACSYDSELIDILELNYSEYIDKSQNSLEIYYQKVIEFQTQLSEEKKKGDKKSICDLFNSKTAANILKLHKNSIEMFKEIKTDLDTLIIEYTVELEEIVSCLDEDEPFPKEYSSIQQISSFRNTLEKCNKDITGIIMDMTLYAAQPEVSDPEKIKIEKLVINGKKLKKLYKRLPRLINNLRSVLY